MMTKILCAVFCIMTSIGYAVAGDHPIAYDLFDSSKYEYIGSYIRDCGEISESRKGRGQFNGKDFPFGDYRGDVETEAGTKAADTIRERRVIKCEIYKSKDFKGQVVIEER
jgi:hypothetical protein